jgi:release factor glutamine methyltransferase
VTVPHLIDGVAEQLRSAGIESPRREARLLLSHALGLAPDSLVLTGTPDHLERGVADALVAALKRRLNGEPLAYVLGHKEFWSLDFAVGPGVLVPRPESETLIEAALHAFPDRDADLNVLDLGTGSGCLVLAFLHERRRARGHAIDVASDALEYAQRNAVALGVAECIVLEQRDWSCELAGQYDVIFVNPPYLSDDEVAAAPPELRAEPRMALAGGPDGLEAFREIAPQLVGCLAPQGRAFVEIGSGQAEAASQIFSSAGLETQRAVPDLSGIPRCLVLAGPLA